MKSSHFWSFQKSNHKTVVAGVSQAAAFTVGRSAKIMERSNDRWRVTSRNTYFIEQNAQERFYFNDYISGATTKFKERSPYRTVPLTP